MRKLFGLGIVIAVLLGPAGGLAGAQTEEPAPTDALCAEDPLAALPAELGPLTDVLAPLLTTFCDAIPEGGGLPAIPGAPGGGAEDPTGGGIPILSDVLAPLCGAGTDGLGALPAEAAPLVDLLGTLLGTLCGDTTGTPSGNPLGAFCDPASDPFAALPAQLAPVTDLLGTVLDALCGLLGGGAGGGEGGGEGGETAAPPAEATPPGSDVLAGGVGAATLPETGTDGAPLVAGSLALAGLAVALRALRTRTR